MTQLPKPHRIVIGARAHAELAERLHAARPNLEIRGRRYTDGTPDDLAWGDLSKYDGIMTGEASVEDKGAEILELLLVVASGKKTKSEELGYGGTEFVPWQIGAVM